MDVTGPGGLTGSANPLVVSATLPRVYWGDLHGHSGLSDGTGTPEDFYLYARDVAARRQHAMPLPQAALQIVGADMVHGAARMPQDDDRILHAVERLLLDTLACAMAGPVFGKTTGAQVPIDGGNERVI